MDREDIWIVPEDYRIGPTIGYDNNADLCNSINADLSSEKLMASRTYQFYVSGDYPPMIVHHDELAYSIEERDLSLHFHASCRKQLIHEKDYNTNNSIDYLIDTLRSIGKIRCDMVVHTGSISPDTQYTGLANSVNTIVNSMRGRRTVVKEIMLLENSCGRSAKSGRTFNTVEDMRKTFELIDITSTLGICLDTCHSYAAGVNTWSDYEHTTETLEQIYDIRPIKCLHLNDSVWGYNSKKDRHRIVEMGEIWSNPYNLDGLRAIVSFCREKEIDMITEANHEIDAVEDELRTFHRLLQL